MTLCPVPYRPAWRLSGISQKSKATAKPSPTQHGSKSGGALKIAEHVALCCCLYHNENRTERATASTGGGETKTNRTKPNQISETRTNPQEMLVFWGRCHTQQTQTTKRGRPPPTKVLINPRVTRFSGGSIVPVPRALSLTQKQQQQQRFFFLCTKNMLRHVNIRTNLRPPPVVFTSSNRKLITSP